MRPWNCILHFRSSPHRPPTWPAGTEWALEVSECASHSRRWCRRKGAALKDHTLPSLRIQSALKGPTTERGKRKLQYYIFFWKKNSALSIVTISTNETPQLLLCISNNYWYFKCEWKYWMTYQKLSDKIHGFGEEFLWELIFQLYYFLEY